MVNRILIINTRGSLVPTELAAIYYDIELNVQSTFFTLIPHDLTPGMKDCKFAFGIDYQARSHASKQTSQEEMIKRYKQFNQCMDKAEVFVAHNADYVIKTLNKIPHVQIPIHTPWICTKTRFPWGFKADSIQTIAKQWGLQDIDQQYATATCQILFHAFKQINNLSTILNEQLQLATNDNDDVVLVYRQSGQIVTGKITTKQWKSIVDAHAPTQQMKPWFFKKRRFDR
jgi:hypothetical protein